MLRDALFSSGLRFAPLHQPRCSGSFLIGRGGRAAGAGRAPHRAAGPRGSGGPGEGESDVCPLERTERGADENNFQSEGGADENNFQSEGGADENNFQSEGGADENNFPLERTEKRAELTGAGENNFPSSTPEHPAWWKGNRELGEMPKACLQPEVGGGGLRGGEGGVRKLGWAAHPAQNQDGVCWGASHTSSLAGPVAGTHDFLATRDPAGVATFWRPATRATPRPFQPRKRAKRRPLRGRGARRRASGPPAKARGGAEPAGGDCSMRSKPRAVCRSRGLSFLCFAERGLRRVSRSTLELGHHHHATNAHWVEPFGGKRSRRRHFGPRCPGWMFGDDGDRLDAPAQHSVSDPCAYRPAEALGVRQNLLDTGHLHGGGGGVGLLGHCCECGAPQESMTDCSGGEGTELVGPRWSTNPRERKACLLGGIRRMGVGRR